MVDQQARIAEGRATPEQVWRRWPTPCAACSRGADGVAFRIAQLSDAHLSARRPLFEGNFDVAAEVVRAASPDLVIATGDLSLDGADHDADLHHAYARHAVLGLDWLAVPGNHDVGDATALGARQPADAARRARWDAVFGATHFVRDVPGWRILGLDTQDLNEADGGGQWRWLAQAIAGAGSRRVALFGHKPLTEERLDDAAVNYWPVLPAPRARLLALFGTHPPAFVASGHVHQVRDHAADGLRQIWVPAVSFLIGDAWHPPRGAKYLGWAEHVLHPDGSAEHRLHRLDGATPHDLGLMPKVYGPQ
jgi:3',5'-cyclic AMP phosphodiesterase CpdA